MLPSCLSYLFSHDCIFTPFLSSTASPTTFVLGSVAMQGFSSVVQSHRGSQRQRHGGVPCPPRSRQTPHQSCPKHGRKCQVLRAMDVWHLFEDRTTDCQRGRGTLRVFLFSGYFEEPTSGEIDLIADQSNQQSVQHATIRQSHWLVESETKTADRKASPHLR